MSRDLNFSEKTLLSTPNPIHSSSMASNILDRASFKLNDIPERDSDSDASLGMLSIKSEDLRFDGAALLQKERELARRSLKQASKGAELTSLPSRFMKRTELTDSSLGVDAIHSESTISESDLLPGNSSTPRESLSVEYVLREPNSLRQSLDSLVNMVKNPNVPLDTITEMFSRLNKTVEVDGSFKSGQEAVAKLNQDEISWKRKEHIPIELNDFSLSTDDRLKMSMGAFFKERSEDPSKLFGRSPRKSQPPVPLIEVSAVNGDDYNKTWNMTDIQHILSDQNTKDALELFNGICNVESPSPVKKPPKSRIHEKFPSSAKKLSLANAAKTTTKSSPVQECSSRDVETLAKPRMPEASKENVSPESQQEKSILSSRCSSSLSSLPNGKLPIATTKTELIWGCVKPGRSISRDFVLRNRSSCRLGIQCSVSNSAFRLNKDGSELNFSSTLKVILHPYESRTLTVTFTPTSLGAVVDNLNFTPIDANHKQSVKQFMRLFGYGGHGSVGFHNIIKDTTGRFLLSLGNLDEQQEMKRSFVIRNTGLLSTFAHFDFIMNGLYPFSSIAVFPQSAVLLPGEEKEVTVTYNVPKKDFLYIKSRISNCVTDLGKLQVIHGTEVDRARLRKVCQKAKETGQDIKSNILPLIQKFPGEAIPTDLKHFRESLTSIDELLKLLYNEEIVITIEQDIDQTLTEQLEDETAMFLSLYENTNVDTLESTTYAETCQVEPTRIILTPPDKMKDRIFLISNNKKTSRFEVNSAPEGLHLKPREGTICYGETKIIELQYTKQCNDKTVFKVRIVVDNESFEVDVKIVFVNKVQ